MNIKKILHTLLPFLLVLGTLALANAQVANNTIPTFSALLEADINGGTLFEGQIVAFEDLPLNFKITASDLDNDTLTLDSLNKPSSANFLVKTGQGIASQNFTWTASDTGEFGPVTFKVTDQDGNIAQVPFNLLVAPELCKDGDVGRIRVVDVEFDEDEYLAGEDIDLEVEVENNFNKDLDIAVEAFLYNVDQDDVIDRFETQEQEIKDNEEEIYDLTLSIPLQLEDLDEDDDLIMFVKAFEDGNEEDHCDIFLSGKSDFEFIREDDDVVVENLFISKTSVIPNEKIRASVDILNVGNDDQNDVVVELKNSELGINLRSTRVDLERAGDKDEDATVNFDVTIPATANPGDYTFTVSILNENDDPYDRGDQFTTLNILQSEKVMEEPVKEPVIVAGPAITTTTLPSPPATVLGRAVTYFPAVEAGTTLKTAFWIIANIVLIVLIVYFIRLIFKK